MKHVGYNIRKSRLAKNLTQEYVAGVLKMTPAAYGNIERGASNVSLNRLQQIADILEVEPEELLHEKEPINITAPVNNSNIGNNQNNIIGLTEENFQLLNKTLEGVTKVLEKVIDKLK
ncbi:helix-turn-helix domain-containing protein [Chitinophaga polysaccharea]|uniref:helix-turn-helix domain-containing protein n=1 Tax=Chitinophaga polysaccharea TaxID=1293035 RepID=UPI00115B36F8|nr:helix-turn-helix transcriptional regulator [Chitinophaga polysaccharea]